ncbi:MAG: hypothetical protein KBD21_00365 [Candidatus Pacebacteria bacterium]|nr:hypothetical protein [Candidatus Paceibacterota bacterium]
MNSSTIKNIVTMLVVCAGMYGLYVVASNPELRAKMFPSAETIEAQTVTLQNQVLSKLNSINALKIDEDVFSKPEFEALVETNLEVPSVTYSRTDPFAPY